MIDGQTFAAEWCEAWNAHDLDRLLVHFHDDVVFTSPIAASFLPATRGYIRGREALHAYWAEGLRRIPDLRFTVEQIFVGVDTLVIHYRNQKGVGICEVLSFDGDKVRHGHGTYPLGIANPAGAHDGEDPTGTPRAPSE